MSGTGTSFSNTSAGPHLERARHQASCLDDLRGAAEETEAQSSMWSPCQGPPAGRGGLSLQPRPVWLQSLHITPVLPRRSDTLGVGPSRGACLKPQEVVLRRMGSQGHSILNLDCIENAKGEHDLRHLVVSGSTERLCPEIVSPPRARPGCSVLRRDQKGQLRPRCRCH